MVTNGDEFGSLSLSSSEANTMTNTSQQSDVARPSRGKPSRAAVFRRFAAALDDLANVGGLPKAHEARDLWNDLWQFEVHHSTAIEGNTLVLSEVETLLKQGRAVGSKELKDYLEVLGYAEAAWWVYKQAVTVTASGPLELVTVTEVRSIHATAMSKVWDVAPHPDARPGEGPGSFREHEIRPFYGGMTPPTFPLIPSELRSWVDAVNHFGAEVGEIEAETIPMRLAALHVEFERIHPFIDGNGRTGRLVLNLILTRLGWPPVIVRKEQRRKYLDALERADTGDHGPLAELIARAVVDALHRLMPDIAGPAKYVPLEALADADLGLSALKQAAVRGRLVAIIGADGRYRSSRAAVEAYKASRYRRT